MAAQNGRHNPDSRRAQERAAQRCQQPTHKYVEIDHQLQELLDKDGGDIASQLPRI
ncbi:hypothetical protein V2A87_51955, partial [Pseudomonas aeruginosa]